MTTYITTHYYSASGPTLDACAYLGQRYDEERGYAPFEDECWVMSSRPGARSGLKFMTHFGTTGWLTRLWRSPRGAVFASSTTDSKVIYHPDLHGDEKRKFESMKLGVPLNGVWGLEDDFVLAWGATYEGTRHVFRYDGKRWQDMPAPKFEVRAMHGLAPDLVYAVGVGGGLARWNGKTWRRVATPTKEVLNSVFVATEDEVYATGGDGSLLQGNKREWDRIAEPSVPVRPLLGVAKWNNELWVAAGRRGLLKRTAKGELECVKPNLRAVDLDARKDLIIACGDMIATTKTGKSFTATGQDCLLKQRARKKLGRF